MKLKWEYYGVRVTVVGGAGMPPLLPSVGRAKCPEGAEKQLGRDKAGVETASTTDSRNPKTLQPATRVAKMHLSDTYSPLLEIQRSREVLEPHPEGSQGLIMHISSHVQWHHVRRLYTLKTNPTSQAFPCL